MSPAVTNVLLVCFTAFSAHVHTHTHTHTYTVPACDGKGSYDSFNGIKATEYLIRAEALCSKTTLFSWVLFRPPWSLEVVSSKMCVFHHMRLACQDADTKHQVL